MCKPPILFLVFNRPDTTRQVFEAIRQTRPVRLYVAADGPRVNRKEEAERCEETRHIATRVDWPCEVRTLFRDQNLGCRRAVSGAVSWLFENEEEGIILEDDCLPAPSFFLFCAELLDHYRHDERIMCITGDNFQESMADYPYSYYFSRYNHCWGWASWRRAWRLYDSELAHLSEFIDSGNLLRMSCNPGFADYWRGIFTAVKDDQINSWAYPWLATCWEHSGLTATPRINLVSNIGFGSDGTHTLGSASRFANMAVGELKLPLSHPAFVAPHAHFDAYIDRNNFYIGCKEHSPETLSDVAAAVKVQARWLRSAARRLLFRK